MITKAIAEALRHGQTLYCLRKNDSRGNPMRIRVSGKCKTWVRQPDRFKIPVKYGLYESGYVDNFSVNNAADWTTSEEEAKGTK